MTHVLKYENIDMGKIIYDDFILTDNKQYVVSKYGIKKIKQ